MWSKGETREDRVERRGKCGGGQISERVDGDREREGGRGSGERTRGRMREGEEGWRGQKGARGEGDARRQNLSKTGIN